MGLCETNGVIQARATHLAYWKDEHERRIVDQLVEEMAELTVELLHRRRGELNAVKCVGEIADVVLCLNFLVNAMGIGLRQLDGLVTDRAGRLDYELERRRWERDKGDAEPERKAQGKEGGS